ncbi:MAG: GNAT family N-acetyltransferase [Myxococcales bacterium]|nr:GNAT family N-acetyltransferase [Myxococcales bacterium]
MAGSCRTTRALVALVAGMIAVAACPSPAPAAPSRGRLLPIRRHHLRALHQKRAANALSVVRYGTGSGFLVYRERIPGSDHDRGLVLTNHHVAGGAKFRAGQLLVLGDGSSARTQRLLSSGVGSDHALVEITLERHSGVQPALLDTRGPRFEQPVYIIGSAHQGVVYGSGKMNARSRFIVGDTGESLVSFASVDGSPAKSSYVHRARLPTRGGMSGSPVVSRRSHRVVGLHCGGGGQTACLVSMKRVLDDLQGPRGVKATDKALLERMLSWQRRGVRPSSARTIKRLASEKVPRVRFGAVSELRSSADVADAENLGSLFFTGTVDKDNRFGHFTVKGRQSLGIRTARGELAAFLSYQPQQALRFDNGKAVEQGTLYVSWLGTHPRYSKMGLASKLLGHVVGLARAQNKRSVTLDVEADNVAARALYHKRGFRVVRDDGYRVRMELDVAPSR